MVYGTPAIARPPYTPAVARGVEPSAWPDETNTGVPIGTVLTPFTGNLETTSIGQIVENLEVTGNIVVKHAGVTVRKCRITSSDSDVSCVYIIADNCTVEDVECIGHPTIPAHDGVRFDTVTSGGTAQRCNIHDLEDGVVLGSGTNFVIRDNYIHDLQQPDNPDPHIDGIQIFSNAISGVLIEHNNIVGNDTTWSSGMTMRDVVDVTININRVIGGANCIRVEDASDNIAVTDNRVDGATFGFFSIDPTVTNLTFTGNVVDSTDAPIPTP